MRYDKIIQGKKIYLRQLEVEDCKQYYLDWLNNEELNKFIESRWNTYTMESNSISNGYYAVAELAANLVLYL